MRDPFFWSIPLGRVFGITIRVHIMFPVVALAMILRFYLKTSPDTHQPYFPAGTWIDGVVITALFFVSVLLHEFGHCFAARWVDGDATEILMWPLGGLASVDLPHQPRAHFITAAAGPLVNLVLCVVFGLLLAFAVQPGYQPLWNPLTSILRGDAEGSILLRTWNGEGQWVNQPWPLCLARMFWVNWVLFLFNALFFCFPMDFGRMLQALLWPSFGNRQATLVVIYLGFVYTVVVGLVSIVYEEILVFCLAIFIYISCRTQLFILETGGDDGLFGYDFSQGYTSLERDQPQITTKTTSWWKRWRDNRAARKLQREMKMREDDERRLDELLDKVQKLGMNALTDEERRFMKRVSDRYRNRN